MAPWLHLAADPDSLPTGLLVNYGLAGILLAAGMWFLRWLAVNAIKPFVDSTVTNQREQTAQMIAMTLALSRITSIVETLGARIETHCDDDKKTSDAILSEIKTCRRNAP